MIKYKLQISQQFCPPNLKSREISRNDPNKIQGEIKAKQTQISPCILLGSFREISDLADNCCVYCDIHI